MKLAHRSVLSIYVALPAGYIAIEAIFTVNVIGPPLGQLFGLFPAA